MDRGPDILAGWNPLKWDDKIAKVHGYASKLMTIGASNQPLDDFIFIGLTEVLRYAPVLGGFYGRIVAEIPGFAKHMEEFADSYWARSGGETWNPGNPHIIAHDACSLFVVIFRRFRPSSGHHFCRGAGNHRPEC